MAEDKFHPEYLRPPESACEPDPRSRFLVRVHLETGEAREKTLADHHADIEGVTLHNGVPEDVLIQFETARNLYLYAWFVYRFYPVSERHALSCLEYALRDTHGERHRAEWEAKEQQRRDQNPETKKRKYPRPNLFHLLEYAIQCGTVRNEGFSAWHRNAEIRSRERYAAEKRKEMEEKGLDQIEYDDADAVITNEDRNFDYVLRLPEILSNVRNDYSHGSKTLHNHGIITLTIVSEIINQLYPAKPSLENQDVEVCI